MDVLEHFSSIGDGAFAVDDQQRIVFWNQMAVEMLGYAREEALGARCWQLLQGCSLQGKVVCSAGGAIISQVRDGRPVGNFDLCARHRDGHSVLLDVSSIPLEVPETEGRGLLHLIRFQGMRDAWPGMLRVHLLGPTMVKRPDGSWVDGPLWQRVKVRALLAYLVLQERWPVPRETLVETLWPELDYEAGLRNLNTTVYNLRRSLEPELERGNDSRYVFYQGGQYWLGGDGLHWTDTRAFRETIRRARVEPNVARAIGSYEQALQFYRGDYLLDLVGTGVYCPGEQHRYEEWYLSGLDELARLYERQGQLRESENAYLKVLSLAPWRETTGQQLMRLYLRQGRRAHAARVCRRLTAALEYLDTSVSQETRRLCSVARCDQP